MPADHPPNSDVAACVGWVGVIGVVIGYAIAYSVNASTTETMFMLIAISATPMWAIELRRHRGLIESGNNDIDTETAWQMRLRGLLLSALVWAATLELYYMTGFNAISGFWDAVFDLRYLLALVFFAIVCVRPVRFPQLEALGASIVDAQTHGWSRLRWDILRDHLVKAFFLPFMISALAVLCMKSNELLSQPGALGWFMVPMALLYLIDVTIGTVGYLLTSRRIDAHIRSSNPYLMAWIVALACYPPFFDWLTSIGLTRYRTAYDWRYWFDSFGVVMYIWGVIIVLLTAVYAWSTIVFGLRFSNLTYRGVVTHGPYRLTKHPAYICKNISWWMISVPFLTTLEWSDALKSCGALLFVNSIYFLRAWTEEMHLSVDPKYRAYARWIESYGLVAQARTRIQSLFSFRWSSGRM
jgi:hypothetical protein